METIRNLPSREIFAILQPTFKAFYPLLVANKEEIKSITPTTYQYAQHPRQKCDVYSPETTSSTSTTSPVLIYLYGGGLTRGDKSLPAQMNPAGLVYNNLGTFFAKQGYTTIIADYRRVNDASAGTGEDATFPSGGDDLSSVLSWLGSPSSPLETASGKAEKRQVFVMGNSAGGVHVGTFLFHGKYTEQRKSLVDAKDGMHLKGAILLSVPFDMASAGPGRKDVNKTYWPLTLHPSPSEKETAAGHSEHSFGVNGLLGQLNDGDRTCSDLGVPPCLVVQGELDPEDEITASIGRFEECFGKVFGGEAGGLEHLDIKGHNHISPPVALMSGEEGDRWGLDVVEWMRRQ